ncbi:MAG TPA: hypothetical protein DCQ68_01900 [Chryseobacterium indologenes]|nr:hypothetical protein [Chryseobacterium indologenes]
MENIILKLFDWEKVPMKLILLIFIISGILAFLPDVYLNRFELSEFKDENSSYISITFIFSFGFIILSLGSYFIKKIKEEYNELKLKKSIERKIKNLTYHEMYLLAFIMNKGKSTINLPWLDETVISLENKNIIYKSSNSGPVKDSGPYWAYSVSEFAEPHLSMAIMPLKTLPESKIDELNDHLYDWEY